MTEVEPDTLETLMLGAVNHALHVQDGSVASIARAVCELAPMLTARQRKAVAWLIVQRDGVSTGNLDSKVWRDTLRALELPARGENDG